MELHLDVFEFLLVATNVHSFVVFNFSWLTSCRRCSNNIKYRSMSIWFEIAVIYFTYQYEQNQSICVKVLITDHISYVFLVKQSINISATWLYKQLTDFSR